MGTHDNASNPTPIPDFRRLFEALPGLYLVLLPDAPAFTIVAASDAYLRATRTQREKVIGRSIFEVFPDNPQDPQADGSRNLRASLERAAASGQSDAMAVQKYDIPVATAPGGFEERFWSPLNSPVAGENGAPVYIIHRAEDVTEFMRLKQEGVEQARQAHELQTHAGRMEAEVFRRAQQLQQANEQLRQANDQLGRLDQLKTIFFSNVSHEFRTPLTLLLGPLEALLADTGLAPASQELLRQMQRNALRLLRLVNGLLDFSRLEAGRHSARFAPTDLARYTADLASAFHPAMEKAGLAFSVDCAPLPAPLHVDRDMWEKIVMNLLSNAFKFTFEGSVHLRLAPAPDGGAVLTVRDTGTGIAQRELPLLFQRFHRVADARSRSHEGTGIGLALVHELVLLHGGSTQVTSTEGEGTQFTVTLRGGHAHLPPHSVVDEPADAHAGSHHTGGYLDDALQWLPYPPPDTAPASPRTGTGTGRSARVLVADDNHDLRRFLSSLLAHDYEVQTVTDGREALEAIRRNRPDLVLSDVMMPNLDGLALVRALRADSATRTLPVILLSARAGQEASLEGLSAGADDYLAKPFTALELLARVRTHLNMARARDELNIELMRANKELKAFSYTVSHDLRAPLVAIDGFSKHLLSHHAARLDARGQDYLRRIHAAAQRMGELIDDLLELSRVSVAELHRDPVDLSALARVVFERLRLTQPDHQAQLQLREGLGAPGDRRLLQVVLENLLGNAWKFSAHTAAPVIVFDWEPQDGGADGQEGHFVVRDNGAGFDPAHAGKLFQPFERLHSETEFPGTGIGLATVARVVQRHGGRVWAEGVPGHGASIFFTLPGASRPPQDAACKPV